MGLWAPTLSSDSAIDILKPGRVTFASVEGDVGIHLLKVDIEWYRRDAGHRTQKLRLYLLFFFSFIFFSHLVVVNFLKSPTVLCPLYARLVPGDIKNIKSN